jgi:alpha-tubulin suppressor-like RCC1 family protein
MSTDGEGQLAIPADMTHVQEPALIEKLVGCNVVQVACGTSHSLYLTGTPRS